MQQAWSCTFAAEEVSKETLQIGHIFGSMLSPALLQSLKGMLVLFILFGCGGSLITRCASLFLVLSTAAHVNLIYQLLLAFCGQHHFFVFELEDFLQILPIVS